MSELPGILDFLRVLDPLRGEPAAYIVVLTAALLMILRDWRLSIFALMVQYLIAGLLFADILLPYLAFMKVMVGLFVCIVLYISARQVNWGLLPEDITPEEAIQLRNDRLVGFGPYLLPTNAPFRIFAAMLVVIGAWSLAGQPTYQLPLAPDHFNLAVYSLAGLGLVTIGLTSEPLRSGFGLLTLLIGFELFYASVEPSTVILIWLAIATMAVTLVIAYLSQARHAIQALVD